MQKARRHGIAPLRPLVSTRFQVLFTPLFGVLFTFPSRYWSTIGLSGVFSLGGWSSRIQTRFHVPRPTRIPLFFLLLPIRDYHPLWLTFPGYSNSIRKKYRGPTTPKLPQQLWFGLLRFRSPLLTESLLFSSPLPT